MISRDVGILGVVVTPLRRFDDSRGWLSELFRDDELPPGLQPQMGYLSVTKPGVVRGPHEHTDQTDVFVFMDGTYDLYLWENRPGYGTERVKLTLGVDAPTAVVVPPGVVHAYRNAGDRDAFVLNFPNRLYAGWGRLQPVDEIRHEDRPDSPFTLW